MHPTNRRLVRHVHARARGWRLRGLLLLLLRFEGVRRAAWRLLQPRQPVQQLRLSLGHGLPVVQRLFSHELWEHQHRQERVRAGHVPDGHGRRLRGRVVQERLLLPSLLREPAAAAGLRQELPCRPRDERSLFVRRVLPVWRVRAYDVHATISHVLHAASTVPSVLGASASATPLAVAAVHGAAAAAAAAAAVAVAAAAEAAAAIPAVSAGRRHQWRPQARGRRIAFGGARRDPPQRRLGHGVRRQLELQRRVRRVPAAWADGWLLLYERLLRAGHRTGLAFQRLVRVERLRPCRLLSRGMGRASLQPCRGRGCVLQPGFAASFPAETAAATAASTGATSAAAAITLSADRIRRHRPQARGWRIAFGGARRDSPRRRLGHGVRRQLEQLRRVRRVPAARLHGWRLLYERLVWSRYWAYLAFQRRV